MAGEYQLTNDSNLVIRTADGVYVPFDPGNRDYQQFLEWEAAGNTPDPIPGPAKPQSISSTEFLNRFPPAARAAFFAAALTDANMLQMVVTMAAATSIDLGDPQVQGGVQSLVPGILTQDQANAVLDH